MHIILNYAFHKEEKMGQLTNIQNDYLGPSLRILSCELGRAHVEALQPTLWGSPGPLSSIQLGHSPPFKNTFDNHRPRHFCLKIPKYFTFCYNARHVTAYLWVQKYHNSSISKADILLSVFKILNTQVFYLGIEETTFFPQRTLKITRSKVLTLAFELNWPHAWLLWKKLASLWQDLAIK